MSSASLNPSPIPVTPATQAYIAGTQNENSFSAVGVLQSLKLYNDFAQAAAEGKLVPEVKRVWETEAKWLGKAMHAIDKDGYLREKFGSGWDGATQLAPLLKQMYNEKSFMEHLQPHAYTADDAKRVEARRSHFT